MTTQKAFSITPNVSIGGGTPILIAGPCVIEDESGTLRHAERIAAVAREAGMPFVFKASYDKANRSSADSFRGPGLDEGLKILAKVKRELGLGVLTDAHSVTEMAAAGEVVDVVQVPAFLCRQTDLIIAAAKTGKVVNVKKGQFLAPDDMGNVIAKLRGAGCERILLTERGSSFGYHRLVVDFTGIVRMREFGYPVIFDATHSVQAPGGLGDKSGGERRYAPFLAYAAAAVGVDGLFVEVHEDPDRALSDGPNMIPLDRLKEVLERFVAIAGVRNERVGE